MATPTRTLLLVLACLAVPAAALAGAARADAPTLTLMLAHRAPSESSMRPDAHGSGALENVDPWFAPLRALVEERSDAYMDRPHLGRFGQTSGEPAAGRQQRLDGFTSEVLAAVRDRAGELAQYGAGAAWSYAATLVWIAARETRIASSPGKLGDQDQGRAHGYWQVWDWHGQNPYLASTALDMLLAEPGSSWSLPKRHPWLGYPKCAQWLAAHPPPSL